MAKKGRIDIHEDRCKGCGVCVPACPQNMLRMSETRFNAKGYRPVEEIDPDDCTGCAVCAIVCPDVVFTVYKQAKKPKQVAAA